MNANQDDPLQSEQRNRAQWRGGDEGGLSVDEAGGHLPPESERSAGDEDREGPAIAPTVIPPD